MLASPRLRRRAFRVGLVLAVVVAGTLVSVVYRDTGTIVETSQHGRADLYVPPLPVDLAAAERREVIAIAARFVESAVARDHAERAFELAGPNLRNGTTVAQWRAGEIPVVPYPVGDARWKLAYSYADEIGLRVAVFPAAGVGARPMVFDLTLRAFAAGAERRWLVDSWSPRGAGLGGPRPRSSDGSPFRIDVPAASASTSLGAAWLLFPAGLIALVLVVPWRSSSSTGCGRAARSASTTALTPLIRARRERVGRRPHRAPAAGGSGVGVSLATVRVRPRLPRHTGAPAPGPSSSPRSRVASQMRRSASRAISTSASHGPLSPE